MVSLLVSDLFYLHGSYISTEAEVCDTILNTKVKTTHHQRGAPTEPSSESEGTGPQPPVDPPSPTHQTLHLGGKPGVHELEDLVHVQVAVLLVVVGVVAVAAVRVGRVAVQLHLVLARAREALLPGGEL